MGERMESRRHYRSVEQRYDRFAEGAEYSGSTTKLSSPERHLL